MQFEYAIDLLQAYIILFVSYNNNLVSKVCKSMPFMLCKDLILTDDPFKKYLNWFLHFALKTDVICKTNNSGCGANIW
jgi:hypothetical protein